MIVASKDPMGQAIHDYFEKKSSNRLRVDSTITEDEEIEVSYLFREFNEMPMVEQEALQLCEGKVLDVGAGSGSHSLYLQQEGMDVKAIDLSELSVAVMQKRGVINAICADFFTIENKEYDTLLLLMNGVGIAGDLVGLEKLLTQSKKLLNKGGQILLDSSDIIYMFDESDSFSTDPGEYYGELQYQMSYDEIMGEPFYWLFVGFDLLMKYAYKHGFNCEMIHEGEHYDYLARLTIK